MRGERDFDMQQNIIKSLEVFLCKKYVTEDGYALGIWIFDYRNAYHGKKSPVNISKEQIEILESIGMDWNPSQIWDQRFQEAETYFKENGKLPSIIDTNKNVVNMAT